MKNLLNIIINFLFEEEVALASAVPSIWEELRSKFVLIKVLVFLIRLPWTMVRSLARLTVGYRVQSYLRVTPRDRLESLLVFVVMRVLSTAGTIGLALVGFNIGTVLIDTIVPYAETWTLSMVLWGYALLPLLVMLSIKASRLFVAIRPYVWYIAVCTKVWSWLGVRVVCCGRSKEHLLLHFFALEAKIRGANTLVLGHGRYSDRLYYVEDGPNILIDYKPELSYSDLPQVWTISTGDGLDWGLEVQDVVDALALNNPKLRLMVVCCNDRNYQLIAPKGTTVWYSPSIQQVHSAMLKIQG